MPYIGRTYVPPPYRPRLFPRLVRWMLTGVASLLFILFCLWASWPLARLACSVLPCTTHQQ